MRRTLAITLVAAVVLVGGCARHRAPAEPATTRQAAPVESATPRTTAPVTRASHAPAPSAHGTATAPDVDGLLDDVDRQLGSDDQPVEDQD
ncbi:hypothetical protein [Krasilnikovia sp. MM14-A1259]|uniref:hypothetical protein n=1 Tax=Krasilnikovia sp. MM14-A1259 TaxID=3373539 RepID=UPI00380E6634